MPLRQQLRHGETDITHGGPMMDGEWNDPPFLVCRSLARERPLQGGAQDERGALSIRYSRGDSKCESHRQGLCLKNNQMQNSFIPERLGT
jgi:hypothetical protein